MDNSGMRALPPRLKKRYHRRNPWACDECRLRKRKCDSLRPCGPCSSMGLPCRFESREPVQHPTLKVRTLTDRLRHVRCTIEQLKTRGGGPAKSDFDAILQALDDEAPPRLTKTVPSSENVENMMGGGEQFVCRDWDTGAFMGASSGFSFVSRTLELFSIDSDVAASMGRVQSAMMALLDAPLSARGQVFSSQHDLQKLPAKGTSTQLVDSLFLRCSPIMDLFQEAEVRQLLDCAYHPALLSQKAHREDVLMLIHVLLALGYLYHMPLHRTKGCQLATSEAIQHFSLVHHTLDISRCNSLLSLQIILCLTIFLMSSSRIAAAHGYLGVACSLAMRLGLHFHPSRDQPMTSQQRQNRVRTLVTILKLDYYSVLVLGWPSLVDTCGLARCATLPESGTLPGAPFSDTSDFKAAMRLELSYRHLDLLKMTTSGLGGIFTSHASSRTSEHNQSRFLVSLKYLKDVGKQLQEWAKGTVSLLQRLGSSSEYNLARYEIEMLYYLCQTVLHQPFLQYLNRMAKGEPLARNELQQALACIKASSITISRSEAMIKSGIFSPASWLQVYGIFLSVTNLIFLIAAHNGTSKPSEAWGQALSGIRLLAAARCHVDSATACLEILEKLSSELSHTVHFDIDQIRSSTARLCQYSLIQTDLDQYGGRLVEFGRFSDGTADFDGVSLAPRDLVEFWDSSLELHETSSSHDDDAADLPTLSTSQCDADEILARSQDIILDMDWTIHEFRESPLSHGA